MRKATKVVSVSVPLKLALEVERIAKEERRTKSELFREMVRVYQCYRKQRDEEEDEQWIMNLIQEVKEEEARNPMTEEELLREFEELGRYGAQQAKKLGIKPKDVNRIIDEARKRWRSA